MPNKYSDFVAGIELSYEANPVAVIETEYGMFAFELFENLVPTTVENFVALANRGFYNGLKWHLVLPGIKIQAGDPTGSGTSGANIAPIALETHPDLKHDKVGMVGMARYEDDLNSATSQFYITLDAESEWDRKYAIFGQVLKGSEVLGAIQKSDLIKALVIVE